MYHFPYGYGQPQPPPYPQRHIPHGYSIIVPTASLPFNYGYDEISPDGTYPKQSPYGHQQAWYPQGQWPQPMMTPNFQQPQHPMDLYSPEGDETMFEPSQRASNRSRLRARGYDAMEISRAPIVDQSNEPSKPAKASEPKDMMTESSNSATSKTDNCPAAAETMSIPTDPPKVSLGKATNFTNSSRRSLDIDAWSSDVTNSQKYSTVPIPPHRKHTFDTTDDAVHGNDIKGKHPQAPITPQSVLSNHTKRISASKDPPSGQCLASSTALDEAQEDTPIDLDELPNVKFEPYLDPFGPGELYTGDTFSMLAQTLGQKDGWVLILPDVSRSRCAISKDTSDILVIVFFPKEAHWAALHFILSGKKIVCRFFDTIEAKREDRCEERSLACMKELAPWLKQVDHKLTDEGDFDLEAANTSFQTDSYSCGPLTWHFVRSLWDDMKLKNANGESLRALQKEAVTAGMTNDFDPPSSSFGNPRPAERNEDTLTSLMATTADKAKSISTQPRKPKRTSKPQAKDGHIVTTNLPTHAKRQVIRFAPPKDVTKVKRTPTSNPTTPKRGKRPRRGVVSDYKIHFLPFTKYMKEIGAELSEDDESAKSENSVMNNADHAKSSPRPASRLSSRDSDELSDNGVLVCPDSEDDTRTKDDTGEGARLSIEL